MNDIPVIGTPMSANQVARIVFNRSRDWFYRHRRILEDERGFPKRGETGWDPVAIARWQARRRGAAPPAATNTDDSSADRLAANAAAVAADLQGTAKRASPDEICLNWKACQGDEKAGL